eukprot:TRINITY_DN25111_c0_g4_i1.p1 TRINITY_DN25111_c0_g4~~TRINITY_DN25111_c0_g4_i1.p1  ORF type:complete len:582 (-),score=74.03 TRINITY_DN25111_c0_g4_i1:38-1603(-)
MAYCVGEQARQAARSVDKRLRPLSDTFVSISEAGSGTGGCRVRSHSYSGYTTYQQSKIQTDCIQLFQDDLGSTTEQWPCTDDEDEEEKIVASEPKLQFPMLLGSRSRAEKKPSWQLESAARSRPSWCDVEEDIDDEPPLMPSGASSFFEAVAPEADSVVDSNLQCVVSTTSYALSGWTSSTHSGCYDGFGMSAESTPTVQFHGHAASCTPMSSNPFALPAVQATAERPKGVTLALACALTPDASPGANMPVMPSGFCMGQTMVTAPPFPCGAYGMVPSTRSAFDAAIDAQLLPPLPKADSLVTLSTAAATPTSSASCSTPAGDRVLPQSQLYLGTVPAQTPKTPLTTQDSEPFSMLPESPALTSSGAVATMTSSAKLLDVVAGSGEEAAGDDAGSSSRTTVMLRNLPIFLTQRRLLEELDVTGFKGLYDFCYMPCCFTTGHGKGFAFVNFALPEHATTFMNSWGAVRKFGIPQAQPALNISYADIQGKDANAAKWDNQRLRRVRNPKLRPFISDLSVARLQ